MSNSDRLVLVGPLPPPWHGQATAFQMLVDAVRERGIPYDVVNLAHGRRAAASMGLPTIARVADYVRIFANLARVVAGRGVTVYLTMAQSSHGFLRDAVVVGLARLRGHRIVGHLHGGNYHGFYASCGRLLQWMIRRTLRQFDSVIVLGEGLRECFSFAPELSPKLRVVPNGLPGPAPSADHEPAPIEEGGTVRVLYLSNLIESKGYIDLLQAIPILRDEYGVDDIVFDFCGEFLTNPVDDERVTSREGARRWVDDFIRENRLADVVHFHGPVTGSRKESLLRAAHIFVLPTYYSNEGQPISILEAMAHGTVVVTTPYRAIPDMVADGATGIFVEPRNPRSIAAAIYGIATDPDRRMRMGRAAIARVRDRFTSAQHVSALICAIRAGAGAPIT